MDKAYSMGKVVNLKPVKDAPAMLRRVADRMEQGEISRDDCTLIVDGDVYHFGEMDDETAAQAAIFNMNYGIAKMMAAAVRENTE